MHFRYLIPVFLFLSCSSTLFSQAPNYAWTVPFEAYRGEDVGLRMGVDSGGNVVVLGSYNGRLEAGDGSASTVHESPEGFTGWLAKWNAQNELLWSMNVPVRGSWVLDNTADMVLDPQGNIYVSGNHYGNEDLDPGPGIFTLPFGSRTFVLKLNPDGVFLWATGLAGTYSAIYSLSCDTQGNLLVCGDFNGTVDFDPGAGESTLVSSGSRDVFLWKLDPDGNLVWAQTVVENQVARNFKSATDSDGNVLVFGGFTEEADLDPGAGVQLEVSDSLITYFIQKFAADGGFLWAKTFGKFQWYEFRDITCDLNGYVYTTGSYTGTSDFDPGPDELLLTPNTYNAVFVQKWTPDGTLLWVRSIDGPYVGNAFALAVDDAGNVYSTGKFLQATDFDPGPGEVVLDDAGNGDVYVHKLSADGDFVWVRSIESTGPDGVYDLALHPSGEVLVTGSVGKSIDFDPGPGTVTHLDDGSGSLFVLGLSGSGDYVRSTTAECPGGDAYTSGLSVDAAGHLVLNGTFRGSFDTDPGPDFAPVYSFTETGFVQGFDPDGNLEWTYVAPQRNVAAATDAWNNVWVAGTIYGVVDFDPGPGELPAGQPGRDGLFVLKLSQNGEVLWVKAVLGNSSWPYANVLTTDAAGNVIITGNFNNTMDFDPGPGDVTLNAGEGRDLFVWKLDASGRFLWVKQTSGDIGTYSTDLTVNDRGDVFVTGLFAGEVAFDPSNTNGTVDAGDSYDAFLIRYGADGKFVRAQTWVNEGILNKDPKLAVDGFGHLFLAYPFSGTLDADAGSTAAMFTSEGGTDVLVVKMDGNGAFVHAVRFGGADGHETVNSLCVDGNGNLYLTGTFVNEVDFDPDPVESHPLTDDSAAEYLTLLSNDLDFRWAGAFGNGYGAHSALDAQNNLYVFAGGWGYHDTDPGEGEQLLTSNTNRPYLVKMTRAYPAVYGSKLPLAWPNPTFAVTTISLGATLNSVDITVATADGKQVLRQHAENTRYVDVNLHTLPSGVYFISLEGDNGWQETVRVVKN